MKLSEIASRNPKARKPTVKALPKLPKLSQEVITQNDFLEKSDTLANHKVSASVFTSLKHDKNTHMPEDCCPIDFPRKKTTEKYHSNVHTTAEQKRNEFAKKRSVSLRNESVNEGEACPLRWWKPQFNSANVLYSEWETDTCSFEFQDFYLPSTLSSNANSYSMNISGSYSSAQLHDKTFREAKIKVEMSTKKIVLFKPRLLKHSQSIRSDLSPEMKPAIEPVRISFRKPASETHTKLPSKAEIAHRKAAKSTEAVFQTSKPSNETIESSKRPLLPVLRLAKIESCELDSSESEDNNASSFVQPVKKRIIQPTRQRATMGDISELTNYMQILTEYKKETAEVLGSSKTLRKRRNERMIIPKRLFKGSERIN